MLSHYSAPPPAVPRFGLRTVISFAMICVFSFAAGMLFGNSQMTTDASKLQSNLIDDGIATVGSTATSINGTLGSAVTSDLGQTVLKTGVDAGATKLLGGDTKTMAAVAGASLLNQQLGTGKSLTGTALDGATSLLGTSGATGAMLGGLGGAALGGNAKSAAIGAVGGAVAGKAFDLINAGGVFGGKAAAPKDGDICLTSEEAANYAKWRTSNPPAMSEVSAAAASGVVAGASSPSADKFNPAAALNTVKNTVSGIPGGIPSNLPSRPNIPTNTVVDAAKTTIEI